MNTTEAAATAREVLAMRQTIAATQPSLDRGLRVAVFLGTWFFSVVAAVLIGGLIGSGPGASVGMVIGLMFGAVLATWASQVIRVAAQWERAVLLRLGKFKEVKGPGVIFVFPVFDNVRIIHRSHK